MSRHFSNAALGGALLAALVSCGDDSDKGTSPVNSDAAAVTTLNAADAKAAYCAIEASVDAMFTEAFTGIEPPSDEASATVAAAVLEQYGDEALAAAPPETADEVAVVVSATEKMAESSPGAFDTFMVETQEAGDVIEEVCGT